MIPSYVSPDGNYTRYGLFFDCGYSAGVGSEMYLLPTIAELLIYLIIIYVIYVVTKSS